MSPAGGEWVEPYHQLVVSVEWVGGGGVSPAGGEC